MFEQKRKTLFTSAESKKTTTMNLPTNGFLKASTIKQNTTTALGNGAVKLTSTGSDFVDQFGKAGNYKTPRKFDEVSKDMRLLWNQNAYLAVCLTFYLRMITRVVNLFDGSRTKISQKGQGL